MSFAVTLKDAQDLRKFIPLNILSANRFEALCAEAGIEEVPRGGVLFRQGDAKNEFVYVLSGTISLQAGGMEMETIVGGTESARFALAHQIPRKVSAVAKDRVRFIRVDAAYVNQPSENVSVGKATYEVSDMAEDSEDDWVTMLLKSPIFQRLPPANLQNILSLLEEVPVKAGQEIVRQDEPGDYYYVIKRGRCSLTRKPSRLARELKLAELKTCDTFGEDSLISDQPRNVTVTMVTDGALLRLGKANFLRLVKEPVISYVSMDVAQRMIQQGAAWLDVRTGAEFEEGHLPDSVNVPFFQLRMELPRINRNVKCILVCDTGRLSEAAAFLLIRHEFDAYVLKGGISGVFKDQLVSGGVSPPSSGGRPERMAPAAPHPAPLEGEGAGTPASVLELAEPHEPSRSEPVPEARVSGADLQASSRLEELRRQLSAEQRSVGELLGQWQAHENASQKIFESSERHLGSARAVVEGQVKALEAIKLELTQLKGAAAKASAPSGDTSWPARFEALSADKATLELELEQLRTSSQARMQAALGEAKSAREGLQQRLARAEADLQASLSDKASQHERLKALEAAGRESGETRQSLERSEALCAALTDEKKVAEARAEELAEQVSELSALVQEFVDNHDHGEGASREQIDSLIMELETVRHQAGEDVDAMQAKLQASERELERLRQQIDTLCEQQLREDVERQHRAEGLEPLADRSIAWRGRIWSLAYALILLSLGAALLLVLLLGTEDGKALNRKLIDSIEQGAALVVDSPDGRQPAP
jgi:CRP-like cAMP-binding protein